MRCALAPLDVERDVHVLHAWVTHPRSRFWMMQGASVDDVRAEYAGIVASDHHDAWLGSVDGVPAFLAETYDPARSPLQHVLDVRPGDLGMHVLVAPTDAPVHGFTTEVFSAVLRHCFAQVGHAGVPTTRVVVEPDVANAAVHALNARAGFVVEGEVTLPDKRALLSTCTHEQWLASELGSVADGVVMAR